METSGTYSTKQYHFAEVDWVFPMTQARRNEYELDQVVQSDTFACGGSLFRLEITPKASGSRGIVLRLASAGPIFRFRIRNAIAETYRVEPAGPEPVRTRGRKWPTAVTGGSVNMHVDLRDMTVGWSPFISDTDFTAKERTHYVSHDGMMRLHFELYIHAEPSETGVAPITGNQLGRDLLEFRKHDQAADARFSLRSGALVGFHKAVVCARSPYMFNIVYNENFARATDQTYDASEFEPEAFMAFLHLLYSDDVGLLTNLTCEQVLEVLRIADLFGSSTVVSACDTCLAHGEMLNVDTCGMLLGIAYKFHRTSLRDAALDFFRRNRARVVCTPGFKKCITENAELSIELWQNQ